eukprot:436377_1
MGSCSSLPGEPDREHLSCPNIDDKPDDNCLDGCHHPLQTIDDTILMSNIRDIMEDHQITSHPTTNNKPYPELYKQLVFTKLKLNHSPQNPTINRLKERILCILDEIQRQDVGETHTGPPSHKVTETKTQDYYYNSESYSKQTDSQLTPSKEKE